MKRKSIAFFSTAVSLFFAGHIPAHAYKIKTHVHIANEVIESIRGCSNLFRSCVYLELSNGKIIKAKVKRSIGDAIIRNPDTYILANYGPDAFPDMLVGQGVVHPGLLHGDVQDFGTGDWIKHLLNKASSPQEISFSHGFAAHAAADIFAHTYVNQYAGGEFDLTDGNTEIEERHMLIESLIAKHTPEVKGNSYSYLAEASETKLPLEFLYQQFYTSNIARHEYEKSPFAGHLLLFENIKREFDRALYKGSLAAEC